MGQKTTIGGVGKGEEPALVSGKGGPGGGGRR